MKKICGLLLSILAVGVISGCSKSNVKELICTGDSEGNNMSAGGSVKYIFEDEKLIKSEIDVDFKDITIDNLEETWDTIVTQFTEQNEPVEDTGYVRTVTTDDKNYVFTVSIDIDYQTITDEVMDKYGIEDYRDKTYDEIKELTTKDGVFTCK